MLLAHIVQRAADCAYGDFLADRFFEPLGMTSTFAGGGGSRSLVATGHDQGKPVPSFELDVVNMGAG